MSDAPDGWSPQRRDQELRRIGGLSAGIAVASVGLTAAFGAGIVWDDAHTASQATDTTQPTPQPTPSGTSPSLKPPSSTPTPATTTPKSKSGGS